MSWARLLKRVFDIDIEHCLNCGGALKIIACPEPSSKGHHRRPAGDRQNPQPSRPTDPRPVAVPGSSCRSIPDNLRIRTPPANLSRRRRSLWVQASGAKSNLSGASRPLSGWAGCDNSGFFIKQKRRQKRRQKRNWQHSRLCDMGLFLL